MTIRTTAAATTASGPEKKCKCAALPATARPVQVGASLAPHHACRAASRQEQEQEDEEEEAGAEEGEGALPLAHSRR